MATMKSVEVTAKLNGTFTIESTMGNHMMYVDQPKAAGGDDAGPTPLQYLFLSLAGCIGSLGRIVANQKKLPVRSMEVTVSGDLDVERLMGKSTEGRAGFTGIRATVKIDADMTDEEKLAFLHEVDARCPVSDNLTAATPVAIELAQ